MANRKKSMAERLGRKAVSYHSGCVLWTGKTQSRGYGLLVVDYKTGKRKFVHQLAWELKFGPVPEGMTVVHKCQQKRCINPDHLQLSRLTGGVK